MEQAATVERPTILSEAKRLAKGFDAADAGIGQDPLLIALLRELHVAELVDLVEVTKTGEGQARSIALYRAWIGLAEQKPQQVFAAWYNLAVQLGASGATADAALAFRKALGAKPDFHMAAINAGLCHEQANDPEGALRLWQEALQTDEVRTSLLNQRGRLLETLRRYDEAERCLKASLLTNPHQPDVIHHWIWIRAKTCAWPVQADMPDIDRGRMIEATGAMSLLALSDDVALQDRTNAAWIAQKFAPAGPRLSPPEGYAHRRLRIGYLSSDYCAHPMAYLVADLVEEHDRDRFEVFGYCSTKNDGSAVRDRLLAGFDTVRFVRDLGDEATAHVIRGDEIDILIDLNGLTLGTRLPVLRWRPAPVQITYLGYNGPIPMDELDYIVADRFVIPPGEAARHRPAPLYMPGCFQANDRKLDIAPLETRAAAGLPDDRFVFCCFSNNYKITEAMFAAWVAIMRGAPEAVLWLYADSEWSRRNLTGRWIASGLAEDRLFFAERTDPAVYRSRLALADLFLDTFPYNAGTTASDALRVGLPIVTLTGESFVSRMAGSLLDAVGLPEGIVDTLEAYVDLAVALATDPDRYRPFRAALADGAWARTLGDTPTFARRFEAELAAIALTPAAAREDAAPAASREDAAPALVGVPA